MPAFRQISATGTPSAPCLSTNAFCASENFDAFIVFRSAQPRESGTENSNSKRSSSSGEEHRLPVGPLRLHETPNIGFNGTGSRLYFANQSGYDNRLRQMHDEAKLTAAARFSMYAHSTDYPERADWESLDDHLAAVAKRAAGFAASFGCEALASLSGAIHDLGKFSPEFQAYIRGEVAKGGDHSSAGALLARERLKDAPFFAELLAAIVAGHHAGLADRADLDARLLVQSKRLPKSWQDVVTEEDFDPRRLRPGRPLREAWAKSFERSFLTRMLFSCLVDADFLETEAFYARVRGDPVSRGGHASVATLRDRLRVYMAGRRRDDTNLNRLRAQVLDHAVAGSREAPGLFTLTVPTGGGKTLASLSFALEHAARHGLRRVIYVIPYSSIIEQTTQVFRDALDAGDDVLEHHASFDWDRASAERDEEGRDGLAKLRRAAENWDAPVVVTTSVQFFESLFASKTSRCRKLHNIAGSVVVLDEVQTLPLHLLMPCMAAIEELARNYGTSLVLCTATQSALRKADGALRRKRGDATYEPVGLDIDDARELAPAPAAIYQRLRRVAVERLDHAASDEEIAARFAQGHRMLCIVNSRVHAQTLFKAIRGQPGAMHLTTLMVPRHRRAVLARARAALATPDAPARVVSTSLIEAGVDIDFPEVWRAMAGLDSIAQAAGRCNREGRLDGPGRVVVFEPAESKTPREIALRWQAAVPVLGRHADALGLDAVRDYFSELYFQSGDDPWKAFDRLNIGGRPGVLPALCDGARDMNIPFASVAEAFRLIDETMESVVVPWNADEADDDFDRLVERIWRAMEKDGRARVGDLRSLRLYTVSIPGKARDEWLRAGALRPLHPGLGDSVLRFNDLALYDREMGISIDAPFHRSAESNIMS
ncbi:MAG: CRISPR-associated endonuclease Cas3'' [Methylobacteriaceae bacterium]|nr:CRISPR-associated endonuclease Cas3'' [Methylobacteriaceae bacterium]